MAIMGITLVVASLAVVVNLKSTSMRKKELEYQIREETLEKQKAEEENRARELEEYRVCTDEAVHRGNCQTEAGAGESG